MSQMETSLVFVKPCAVMQPVVSARILEDIMRDNANYLLGFKRLRVTDHLARIHYAEHEKKSFFPNLLAQLRSGPVIAMIFRGPNMISRIRSLAGATMVEKADPNSIRGKYGIIKGLNVLHASDSPASGEREVKLWKEETGLEENGEKALSEARTYIKQWKGKGVPISHALRALCSGTEPLDEVAKEFIHDIYVTANKGTDVTKAEIEKLVSVIDQMLQEK